MESLVLEVEKREALNKGVARRIRAGGRIPGVFYGGGNPSMPIAADRTAFERRIHDLEGTHLIELRSADPALNGKKVVIRDLQEHPVTGSALHFDVYEVALDRAIEVRVPLHFVGKAAGVTIGGILQPLLRELVAECLPTQIPDGIDVDVSALGIHDAIHVGELTVPEGVTVIGDPGRAVVTVVPPSAEKVEEPAEAAAGAAEAPAATAAAPAGGESQKG
jgi:large subunit ribosomal protein L25